MRAVLFLPQRVMAILRFQVCVLSVLWHFPAQSGGCQAVLTNDTSAPWASIFPRSSRITVSTGGTCARGLEFSCKSFGMSGSVL